MKRTLVWVSLVGAALALPQEPRAASPQEKVLARGERVYDNLCSSCHGRYGRGEGSASSDLAVPLPDLTDPAVLSGRSDEAILARITESGSQHTMMVGSVVQPDKLRDAVAFMRTLSVPGEKVSVRAGRDIYNGSCWICHGVDGDGTGPAAKNLVDAKPRDFTSKEFVIQGREEEIARTISLGAEEAFHGSSYMPPWGTGLSEQQIRDVIAYLRTLKNE